MSEDDSKILRPKFGDPPIVIDHTVGRTCSHAYVAVCKNARRVKCRVCRENVDPIDILLTLTRDWDWATHHSRQQDEAQKAVDELKKEAQLLKGKIRRARQGGSDEKIAMHFEELMRRVGEIENHSDASKVDQWRHSFQWLNPEQMAALKEALIRAHRRCEDNQRKEGKTKHVKVLKGGRGAEET